MNKLSAVTRRDFTVGALGSLMTCSLVESVLSEGACSEKIQPITDKWLKSVHEVSAALKGKKLRQVEWQAKIEELFAKVELEDFLKLIDFERLTKNTRFAPRGEKSIGFKFPAIEGLPPRQAFGKQIFAMEKGRSVIPHGHNNMATAFLILKGDFRARHWQRLEDGEKDIIIRPTIDQKMVPGGCSTISDYRDNIHWFTALNGPAFIFNIHVLNLRPDSKIRNGRVYIDPTGEKMRGGMIRAPRITRRKSIRLFG